MTKPVLLLSSLLLLVAFPACQKVCKPGEDVACWTEALKDPEQIEKAVSNLRQINDPAAAPALVVAFEAAQANPEIREDLAEAFKKWKTKEAVKPMLAALDFAVGPSKDGNKAKRTNRANEKIASALGALGDKQAGASLIRLMKVTKEDNVRRASIRALGKLQVTEAIDDLIQILEDPNGNKIIRSNAVFALGEIADPKSIPSLILALYRDKAFFFSHANLALVRIGEPAVLPLVQTLMGKNQDAKRLHEQNEEVLKGAMEANAAKVLGDIQSPLAVEPLLEMADLIQKWEEKGSRQITITRVVNALGNIGDKKALPLILSLMQEEDVSWDVITVCGVALTSIGDRGSIDSIFKIIDKGGHPKKLIALIDAVGLLGTEAQLTKLKELKATHTDVDVQKSLQDAIVRLEAFTQCKEDRACWEGKLKDPSASLREKAIYELGRLGNPASIEAMLPLLSDMSDNVRFALIWAFDRLRSKKPMDAIEELLVKEKGSTRFQVVNYNYQLLLARLARIGS